MDLGKELLAKRQQRANAIIEQIVSENEGLDRYLTDHKKEMEREVRNT